MTAAHRPETKEAATTTALPAVVDRLLSMEESAMSGKEVAIDGKVFRLVSILASTIYGRVWKAEMATYDHDQYTEDTAFRKTVALKVSRVPTLPHSLESPLKEIDVMKKLGCFDDAAPDNRHIVRCIAHCVERSLDLKEVFCAVALEFATLGDLFSCIQPGVGFKSGENDKETIVAEIAHGILRGANFMHKKGIAHLDLSLENIFMFSGECGEYYPKIGDFGMSVSFDPNSSSSNPGSPGKQMYMAPEVARRSKFDPSLADSYSIGVMIFMMLTGYPPYEKPSNFDKRFELIQSHGERGIRHLIKCFGSSASDCAISLLAGLLAPKHSRMSVSEAMSHNFFKKCQKPNRIPEFVLQTRD